MKTMLTFAIVLTGFAAPALGAPPTDAASEAPPRAQSFRDLDTNSDGRLSFSEAFPNPRLSNAFGIIDQNADGFLTAAEIAAVVR